MHSVPLTVVIEKDKILPRTEVGLQSIDDYIKMIDRALDKSGFFLPNYLEKV